MPDPIKQLQGPARPELTLAEPAEMTLADHIPTPGAVIGGLGEVLPRLPAAIPELIGALSQMLPEELDTEAGQ